MVSMYDQVTLKILHDFLADKMLRHYWTCFDIDYNTLHVQGLSNKHLLSYISGLSTGFDF